MPFDTKAYDDLGERNHSLVIHQMGLIGQVNLAKFLGVSTATVSSWKDDKLHEYARACAGLNIQFRSTDDLFLTPQQVQEIDFMVELGRKYLINFPRISDMK